MMDAIGQAMKKNAPALVFTVLELALCLVAVLLDIFLPTVVICAAGMAFLLLRRDKLAVIGFKKQQKAWKLVAGVFGLAVGWTLVDFALILPVMTHVTGTTQDLGSFENLKGDTAQLLFLLAASWTLAAFGEELAYRGFVQNRVKSLFTNEKAGVVVSIVASSVLFGLAHTEQGIVGVVVTTADAVFFSLVRRKYGNLWASVLAHGFLNTIGILAFYFLGPLYGLW